MNRRDVMKLTSLAMLPMMAGVALTVIGVALVVRPADELKERPT